MAKILIVEDDPLMLRMYQKIFTFEKFEVETAADGEEALTKVAAANPTLVLLDIMMPKLNGMQVLEKLKGDDKTKNIPIIMLTNLAGQQDAESALAKGAVKYIIKSEYEPKQVVEIVKEVLAAYAPAPSPPAVTPNASPAVEPTATATTAATPSPATTGAPTLPQQPGMPT